MPKERFVYRCPCCGRYIAKSKNSVGLIKAISKAKKKTLFADTSSEFKEPKEKPTFNFIDIEKDPIVLWSFGRAIIGKFNIYEALLELPPEEREFFIRKLREIKEQANAIIRVLETLKI